MITPQTNDREAENDSWVWCYICHRCYRQSEAILSDGEKLCAYSPECVGTLWRDGWLWSRVLQSFKRVDPALPAVPQHGVVYLHQLF